MPAKHRIGAYFSAGGASLLVRRLASRLSPQHSLLWQIVDGGVPEEQREKQICEQLRVAAAALECFFLLRVRVRLEP